MANTFSLILVCITLFTGIVWILDFFVLKRRRQMAFTQAVGESGMQAPPQPSWLVENAVSIFPVISVVLIVRTFLYEPFQIPSGSMMPTLLIGDFILVEKFTYGLKDPVFHKQLVDNNLPKQGDIVVFKYPPHPDTDYIKRIVGLPGDIIRYTMDKELCIQHQHTDQCQKVFRDHVEESPFIEDRVHYMQMREQLGEVEHNVLIHPLRQDRPDLYQPRPNAHEWVVPPRHYFVMGDNRDNSADSRYWGFVPEENLVGKAVAIWTSFEFEAAADSWLPAWFPHWIPKGIRFERIGGIH